MRRMTRWGGTMTIALSMVAALSACGGEGGELREETERRRQEQAEMEKVGGGGDSAAAKGEDRLPAFVSDSPGAAPAPAPAASDTPPPAQPQTPAGTGQWTASTSEVQRGGAGSAVVRGLRVARNEGFDRVVIDFGQGAAIPGWNIEYIDRPIRRCGSGDVTQVAGDGWLRVRLRTAQAHDDAGNATIRQRETTFSAMAVLREMEMICDFEGDVEIVLGVSRPNPYRVLELQNPSRLVIDVQQ